MPPIATRVRPTPAESNIERQPFAMPRPSLPSATPSLSPNLRCPMPILSSASSDNLRQYYMGGAVPQFRFTPPNKLS